jgi:hypothetical protein
VGAPPRGSDRRTPERGSFCHLVGRDHRDVDPGGDPAAHGRPDESSVVVGGRRRRWVIPPGCLAVDAASRGNGSIHLRHQASLGIRTPELGAKITHSEHSWRTSGDLCV